MGRAVAGHTHARRLFRNVTMIFSRPRSECSGRRQDTDCVTGLCSLKQGVEMAPGGIGRRLVLRGSPLQCQGRCVLAAPRPRSALAGDRPLHRLLPGRSHRSVLWFRATVLLLPATLRVRSPPRAGGELPCSALRAGGQGGLSRLAAEGSLPRLAGRGCAGGVPAPGPVAPPRACSGFLTEWRLGSRHRSQELGGGCEVSHRLAWDVTSFKRAGAAPRPGCRAPRKAPRSASPHSPLPSGPRALPGGAQPGRVLGASPACP